MLFNAAFNLLRMEISVTIHLTLTTMSALILKVKELWGNRKILETAKNSNSKPPLKCRPYMAYYLLILAKTSQVNISITKLIIFSVDLFLISYSLSQ